MIAMPTPTTALRCRRQRRRLGLFFCSHLIVSCYISTLITPVVDAFSAVSSSSSSSSAALVHELVSGDIPWNAYLGEADRSFRLGIQLEKNGQARKAAGCFHEAATLYQCYLDTTTSATTTTIDAATTTTSFGTGAFHHVTCLRDRSECAALLAYACLSLGFLNLDALQNPKAAARLYALASRIDPVPTAVSFDGMGQSLEAATDGEAALPQAIAAYRQALSLQQPQPQYDSSTTTTPEAAGDDNNNNNNSFFNPKVQFHLAVALDRLKNATDPDCAYAKESTELLEQLRRKEAVHACLVDSWGYVRWHTRKQQRQQQQRQHQQFNNNENNGGGVDIDNQNSNNSNMSHGRLNLYRGTRGMLELALQAAMPLILPQRNEGDGSSSSGSGGSCSNGLVCEFGVGSGRTLRMTQEILPLSVPIHGFDTFTGLPQAWGSQPAGAYSTGGVLPAMDDGGSGSSNVHFYKGLFRDTIAPFLHEVATTTTTTAGPEAFLAYANIDCRLYSSTVDILEGMHGRIRPGTIILFSEYICHPTWRNDEFRAFRECCKRFGWKYEYLAFSLSTKQAVVRVTDA